MRFRFIIILSMVGSSLYSQSKKELEAKIQYLQTEIEQLKKPKEADLSSDNKKAGYSMGVLFANNIKTQGADSMDIDALYAGIKDVFGGKPLKLQQQQCMTVVQQYMQHTSERKNSKAKTLNKTFLENNKKNEGVIVTASGLQYKVVTQGNGKTPTPNSNVSVHYTGKLIDGTIFDSSVQRGKPADFGVTQVIRGWTEALQLMKEGDKWMLYIPYELAYGERGSGGTIPPYSTLIFELELIKVN